MNKRNHCKRLIALLSSMLIITNTVPAYAASDPEDKIWEDLKQVIEIVDENHLIDICLEVESEEDISLFVETYLTDGRAYHIGKYYPRLDFYATENEIMEYIKADYVESVWSTHVIPEKSVINVGDMKITPEIEEKIRFDYYALLTGWYPQADISHFIRVGEYVFSPLQVHVGEKFVSIKQAYEEGLITDADLEQIPTGMRVADGKHYADLSEEKENRLKAAYIEELKANKPSWIGKEEVQNLTLDDITISAYYGNFDGREVFVAVDETWDFSTGWDQIRIGGYLFAFSNVQYYTNNLFA